MWPECSSVNAVNLVKKSATIPEIQNFSQGIIFFGAPCMSIIFRQVNCHALNYRVVSREQLLQVCAQSINCDTSAGFSGCAHYYRTSCYLHSQQPIYYIACTEPINRCVLLGLFFIIVYWIKYLLNTYSINEYCMYPPLDHIRSDARQTS